MNMKKDTSPKSLKTTTKDGQLALTAKAFLKELSALAGAFGN
jgi:hypothetical protein